MSLQDAQARYDAQLPYEDEGCDHDWEHLEGNLWRCKECGLEEEYNDE